MSSRILAIDTTSESGSIALIEDGTIVENCLVRSPDGFGHVLFSEVESLLGRRAWSLRDIDCFAAAAGPGSFTGIRVGLAAVKGLGESLGRPVAAVSNLQALAWHGTAALRATVIDARRGEIFGAVYSSSLELVRPEVVMSPEAWLAQLPREALEFISVDFRCVGEAITRTPFASAPKTVAPPGLAGAVGLIASRRLASGAASEAASAAANYVRRSDAEIFWKDG